MLELEYVQILFSDRQRWHGLSPSHFVFDLRQVSQAFETLFLVVIEYVLRTEV